MRTFCPDDPSVGLFLLLKSACHHVTERAFAEASAETGVHGAQALALLALREAGPCSLSELAQRVDIKRAAATTLLRRLEAGGHVRREPSPTDARAVALHLTDRGRAALEGAEQLVARFDRALSEGLDADEIAIVRRFLSAAKEGP